MKVDKNKIEILIKDAECVFIATENGCFFNGIKSKIICFAMSALKELNIPEKLMRSLVDTMYEEKSKKDDIEILDEEDEASEEKKTKIKKEIRKDINEFLDEIFGGK